MLLSASTYDGLKPPQLTRGRPSLHEFLSSGLASVTLF